MGVAGAGTEKQDRQAGQDHRPSCPGPPARARPQLAEGMTELARATGNTNLDPKRFERAGRQPDHGQRQVRRRSATSILAFSKNIAPMAQAAGIGATGVLGISTAFARLGEDGLGAQHRGQQDAHRHEPRGARGRPGDEDLRPDRRARPPTSSSGCSRPTRPRRSPRSPRRSPRPAPAGPGCSSRSASRACAASGPCRPCPPPAGCASQIATATDGLRLREHREGVQGGLRRAERLARPSCGETSEQVAEALGAPLLGPLTMFTDALNKATGGLAKLLNSGPVQAVMKGGVIAGIGALAVKSLIAPIGGAGAGPPGSHLRSDRRRGRRLAADPRGRQPAGPAGPLRPPGGRGRGQAGPDHRQVPAAQRRLRHDPRPRPGTSPRAGPVLQPQGGGRGLRGPERPDGRDGADDQGGGGLRGRPHRSRTGRGAPRPSWPGRRCTRPPAPTWG